MEVLFEIFMEIVVGIAEIIGSTIAETVGDRLTIRSSIRRVAISVLVGILTWAVIIALGFGSFLLFLAQHPIAGCLVAITTFFLIALCICVIVKLNKIIKDKTYNQK